MRYCEAAGVKHIRIHDFRHTHASLLINEGINIMEVSRRLGHRDIKETLETYSHLYPREEDKAVAVLNRIL
jgi:integrase